MAEKTTIVYTEDNRDISTLMEDYFRLDKREDFEIVGFAYDGVEALDMIVRMLPDIVILDMKMPRLSGWELLERINGMALSKRPQFVVLSAIDDTAFIQSIMAEGVAAYVKKPFDMQHLYNMLLKTRQVLRQ